MGTVATVAKIGAPQREVEAPAPVETPAREPERSPEREPAPMVPA